MTAQQDTTAYKFGDVLLPRTFVVCGVELRPFSLGHLIILKDVLKSPLLAPEATPVNDLASGLTQFFTAVLVCGMTFEDGLIFINDEKERNETIAAFNENLKRVMGSVKDWNYHAEINLFNKYLETFIQVPLFKELHKTQDFPSGMDDAVVTTVLFKKLGVSESEVLNMPFNKLQILKASYLESEGAIRVFEKRVVDHLKKQEESERQNKIVEALKAKGIKTDE